MAVLLGGFASAILVQFVPGRIDHHGLQIVLVLAAVAAVGLNRGAWAAVACAVSLNVGLETAPYLIVIAAFVAARWARFGAVARPVAIAFGIGIACAVPLLFAGTVPFADWPLPKGDAIGRGHVVLSMLGGGGLALLALAGGSELRRWARLAGLAGALSGLLGLAFPEMIAGPYSTVGPLLARLWMSHILETRSIVAIFREAPLTAVAQLSSVLPCAAIAAHEWYRRPTAASGIVAATALLAIVLACWQLRALALASAVGVPAAAVLLSQLWQRRLGPGGTLLPFVIGLLLLGQTPTTILDLINKRAKPVVKSATINCEIPATLVGIAALPTGLVLAPIDMGGSLVALTRHSVLATSIHRGVHGDILAYRIFLARPDVARSMIEAAGVDYLAYCPGSAENDRLAADAPQGLMADLMRDSPPRWLARSRRPAPVRSSTG